MHDTSDKYQLLNETILFIYLKSSTNINIPDYVNTYWAAVKVKENILEFCSHPSHVASEG